MSRALTVTCNFCGKKKGETNHWWSVRCDQTGMVIAPFDPADPAYTIDACGMQCATQALARFLDHGSFAERKPDAAATV